MGCDLFVDYWTIRKGKTIPQKNIRKKPKKRKITTRNLPRKEEMIFPFSLFFRDFGVKKRNLYIVNSTTYKQQTLS